MIYYEAHSTFKGKAMKTYGSEDREKIVAFKAAAEAKGFKVTVYELEYEDEDGVR